MFQNILQGILNCSTWFNFVRWSVMVSIFVVSFWFPLWLPGIKKIKTNDQNDLCNARNSRNLPATSPEVDVKVWNTYSTQVNYYIIEIGQNTEKSLGDLRRLAAVKNSQGVNNKCNKLAQKDTTGWARWSTGNWARYWNLTTLTNGISTTKNLSWRMRHTKSSWILRYKRII